MQNPKTLNKHVDKNILFLSWESMCIRVTAHSESLTCTRIFSSKTLPVSAGPQEAYVAAWQLPGLCPSWRAFSSATAETKRVINMMWLLKMASF